METLSEGPLSRKRLEKGLGYSPGGANGILKKLEEEGLVRSGSGVYSLTDDFEEKIQPFLEANKEAIEEMKKAHDVDRQDQEIRLEAWRMAHEDGEEDAIQKTAMESQGVYCLMVTNPEAVYNRLRIKAERYYHQLKRDWPRREHERLGGDQNIA